jgi:class 3 adenylate cyclase
MRHDLPSGMVTFLFTDLEGSMRLLESLGAERYADALLVHRDVVRSALAAYDGAGSTPRASRSSARSATHSARSRVRRRSSRGSRRRRSACAWGSTPARRSSRTIITSGSTSTARPASEPAGMAMLDPIQQPLPDELRSTLAEAVERRDARLLHLAVELARPLGYS